MTLDDNTGQFDSSPDSRDPDPLGIIGWVIGGKYKITKHIGGGGFGEVYEGYNENLPEQRLVIKFFKRVQAREKFAKEAKILCMLDHPNISRVVDYLPDEGAVVVAFIDGKDGSKILHETGALSEELFLKVSRSLSDAIAYAHEKKIAHRDIKPGNLLIDKNKNVYLIDFGIAKEIGSEGTKTGYSALTPMFAAPERQQGDKRYDPFISDIYEMGVTLFNFATNDLPYRNPINPNIAEWGGTSAERLSPQLRRILMKATHPDPTKRFQSAAEMAAEFRTLDRAYGGKTVRAAKKSLLIPIATVIVVAIIAVFAWGPISSMLSSSESDNATTQQPVVEEEKPKPAATTPPVTTTSKSPDVATSPVKIEPEKTEPKIIPETSPVVQKKPTIAEPERPLTSTIDTAQQAAVIPSAPPPQVETQFVVRVSPSQNATLLIDGARKEAGTSVMVKPGSHDLMIVQRDYPIYRSRVSVEGTQKEMVVDLSREFASAAPVEMQIALIPPSEAYNLELTLNGYRKTYTRLPILDLKRLPGEWEIGVNLVPAGQAGTRSARIDSCVAFPWGDGPRAVLRGGRGTIRLGSTVREKLSTIPLAIFWKEK